MIRFLLLVPLLVFAPFSHSASPALAPPDKTPQLGGRGESNCPPAPPSFSGKGVGGLGFVRSSSAPPGSGSPGSPQALPGLASGYHQIRLNGHTFTLPTGFTIELAAGPDLAARPIVAAFDEKGRLYVCDSSGSNERVTEQVKMKPHRIVRLEDTNGDGIYDKSTVYVANVMFPEGAMWRDGSLYVSAPPNILKFTDTNDDGKADKEEVWFDGKTLTGCANDLHGPYPGPDGRIYWCKGAFAKQEYKLPNGKPFTTRAAHIFRAKPDGSNIEPVMTGGMDNPVDVVFTPGGDRIFSTTFFQHPGNGKRDGLVHAIYGGVYGKDHDPVHEHPWTSPQLMPVMTHLGPAAPCGLHRYESSQFGKEYENTIFCCQFNLRKISRHLLVPSGSTFTTKDSDFVVSDSLDFHPTDVIEDADGSLLIVDTGGWYKLCCPTSQLVKPDVMGAIYRVKKIGAHQVDDPRGLKLEEWSGNSINHVVSLLDDFQTAVRWRAVEWLAARGQKAIKPLVAFPYWAGGTSSTGTLHALHALTRIDHPDARKVVREIYLDYQDDAVHTAAIHSAGLWRDKEAVPQLVARFKQDSPHVRRAAAEALGRIGDPKAVHAILQALTDKNNDRALDHSLTYALIEIGDPKAVEHGLTHKSPRVRRAAIVALDQIPGGKLEAETVLAELDASDSALRETAWWIAGRHPQWGDRLAGRFRVVLRARGIPEGWVDERAGELARFASNSAIEKLLAEAVEGKLTEERGNSSIGRFAPSVGARAMARASKKTTPPAWFEALGTAIARKDHDLGEFLHTARVLPPSAKAPPAAFTGTLLTLSLDTQQPAEVRLAALASLPPGEVLSPDAFAFVIQHLAKTATPAERGAASDAILRASSHPDRLMTLAAALKTTGPLDLAKLLPAFAKSTDDKVGLALVTALSDPNLRAVVRVEQVKPMLDKYPQPVQVAAETLYAQLAEVRKDERAKLERLVKEMPTGDIRRGQVVFNGAKAQCVACHKIGYVGGLVGPDLTRIGSIRTDRDLLESIVFPSASFVRSYEPVRVTTLDGRILNGILKKDAADEIVLVVAADKEEHVARADVETITPGTVSVMPAGLDQQLTPQDLADLVAFLKACR